MKRGGRILIDCHKNSLNTLGQYNISTCRPARPMWLCGAWKVTLTTLAGQSLSRYLLFIVMSYNVMSCMPCHVCAGRGARAADQQGGSPVSRVRGGVPRGGRVRFCIYSVSSIYIIYSSYYPGMTTCTARAPTVPGTTPTATTARQSITTGRSGTQRAASPSPGHVTRGTLYYDCHVSRTLYCHRSHFALQPLCGSLVSVGGMSSVQGE